MFTKLKKVRQFFFPQNDSRTLLILILFAILASVITYVLFTYTENLLKERLQERLLAIVSTASIQFNESDIKEINKKKMDSFKLRQVVDQLNAIKSVNKNIRYAYIMKRTNDINNLEFIADAESLATPLELDTNRDGILQENEKAPLPGDLFDISEYPTLKYEAFYHPSVDKNLEQDQWSVQMSAYAPIFDLNGSAIAIIGIDVEVSDYLDITQATFFPFLLFILFLVLILTLLTLILVRLWNEKIDAVQELDRQKDELLGLVSHQLATPVSAIKWHTEMMLDGDLGKFSDEQEKTLYLFKNIANELSDLISMILDVSRIQLGKIKIDKQELDLNLFFSEILDIVSPKVLDKKIKFKIDIPKKMPHALLDKRYTHMVIENLLTNAVKYTPTGGNVTLLVKIQKDKLHCEVRDNGVGIPKIDQGKIFGKLFRASNVKNAIDGNGFGLYVAKGAIDAQGGKIWFESEEKKGTTFFVELNLH